MAEPVSSSAAGAIGALQFIWGVLVLPLGWLWARINRHQDALEAARGEAMKAAAEVQADLERHKLHLAHRHFDKDEVKDIIRGTVKPIEESVSRIEASVNRLIDREMNGRRGDQ